MGTETVNVSITVYKACLQLFKIRDQFRFEPVITPFCNLCEDIRILRMVIQFKSVPYSGFVCAMQQVSSNLKLDSILKGEAASRTCNDVCL